MSDEQAQAENEQLEKTVLATVRRQRELAQGNPSIASVISRSLLHEGVMITSEQRLTFRISCDHPQRRQVAEIPW